MASSSSQKSSSSSSNDNSSSESEEREGARIETHTTSSPGGDVNCGAPSGTVTHGVSVSSRSDEELLVNQNQQPFQASPEYSKSYLGNSLSAPHPATTSPTTTTTTSTPPIAATIMEPAATTTDSAECKSDSGCECFFLKHKDLLTWKDPVKTLAVFTVFLTLTVTKLTQPIHIALTQTSLILLVLCGIAKISSTWFPPAQEFLKVFENIDKEQVKACLSACSQFWVCAICQIHRALTFNNPLRSAIVGFALYVALNILSSSLFLCLALFIFCTVFAMFPVSEKLGVDIEPILKQTKGLICSTFSSLKKSTSAVSKED